MEGSQPRTTVAVPVFALALAGGAAASFGVGGAVGSFSDTTEDVFVAAWLLGWVLLVWAAIVGGGYALLLGMRLLSRRPVARSQAALVAAALALIAVVSAMNPLWGTDSAVGGGPTLQERPSGTQESYVTQHAELIQTET